jgi:hypothetical protein
MVNPAIVESQIESGIVFGLTAALWDEITLERGRVQQANFDSYRLLRLNEAPVIEVKLLTSEEAPGGIGEPSTALVARRYATRSSRRPPPVAELPIARRSARRLGAARTRARRRSPCRCAGASRLPRQPLHSRRSCPSRGMSGGRWRSGARAALSARVQ